METSATLPNGFDPVKLRTGRIGLFIPCYINAFYPKAAIATLHLLESVGCKVAYVPEQVCCGQPWTNAGYHDLASPFHRHQLVAFRACSCIVTPSGSCALHLRESKDMPLPTAASSLPPVFELCEFLTDIAGVEQLNACFSHRVALLKSCHGQRGLRLSPSSELPQDLPDKPLNLLRMVRDIEIVEMVRADECCGFGGLFSVGEPALSAAMGLDKLNDIRQSGAEVITATDMSCLIHLEGLLRRRNIPIQVKHIAEILAGEISG